MTGPQDDQLAERLRRATAEVPRSGLDLDDVLRQARVKARRARAVTGAAVVVALAAGGVGAGEVVPRLTAPPAVDDSAVSAVASSADEPRCPDGRALGVWFDPKVQSGLWVTQVERLTAAADGVTSEWSLVTQPGGVPSVSVSGAALPDWYTTVILDRAREAKPALVPAAAFQEPAGVVATLAGGSTVVATPNLRNPQPGETYVAYSGGTHGLVSGVAGCGDERAAVNLEYTTVGESQVVVACAPGTSGLTTLGKLVAIASCPAGLLPAQAAQYKTEIENRPGDATLGSLLASVGLQAP